MLQGDYDKRFEIVLSLSIIKSHRSCNKLCLNNKWQEKAANKKTRKGKKLLENSHEIKN